MSKYYDFTKNIARVQKEIFPTNKAGRVQTQAFCSLPAIFTTRVRMVLTCI